MVAWMSGGDVRWWWWWCWVLLLGAISKKVVCAVGKRVAVMRNGNSFEPAAGEKGCMVTFQAAVVVRKKSMSNVKTCSCSKETQAHTAMVVPLAVVVVVVVSRNTRV